VQIDLALPPAVIMILLEKGNRILEETVNTVINRDPDEKPKQDPMDVKLCDFDDVTYRIEVKKGEETKMKVSMNCPVYSQMEDFGGKDALQKHFPDMVVEADSGYHVAIEVDLSKLSDNEDERDALVFKISTMKGRVMGGMFMWYFDALLKGSSGDLKKGKYDIRSDTEVFFVPREDRIICIYAIDFMNEVDKELARVFMQEFAATRKKISSAPPMNWSPSPPEELVKEFDVKENPGIVGYVSFAVLKSHVSEAKVEQVIHCLVTFRSFVQYHLKMSKSYFHSRMRKRTQELLKVLNRAKTNDPKQEKKKKTASGKTFNR